MGDRGNIAIKQHSGTVYLYSHYGGSELPQVLQDALKKHELWDDPTYLARIIFDAMEDGENLHGSATGLGISASEDDNNHPLINVDCGNQQVSIANKSWSFQEFISSEIPND
jgi:hypothetical protein